jgi:HEAT repeat protein
MLMPQNLFHRRTRRLDDAASWEDNPRIMWRFWLYRTTESPPPPAPASPSPAAGVDWHGVEDSLTRADLSLASSDQRVVWDSVLAWTQGQSQPIDAPYLPDIQQSDDTLGALRRQLYSRGEGLEVERIGAAYKLGLLGQKAQQAAAAAAAAVEKAVVTLLTEALQDDRECVRRAASYSLVVLGGESCTEVLAGLVLPGTAAKWVRKNALWCLGELALPSEGVVGVMRAVLTDAERNSVHLRATAAMAIGDMLRRALAPHRHALSLPLAAPICAAVDALLDCVSVEPNRIPNANRQGRSVCEYIAQQTAEQTWIDR